MFLPKEEKTTAWRIITKVRNKALALIKSSRLIQRWKHFNIWVKTSKIYFSLALSSIYNKYRSNRKFQKVCWKTWSNFPKICQYKWQLLPNLKMIKRIQKAWINYRNSFPKIFLNLIILGLQIKSPIMLRKLRMTTSQFRYSVKNLSTSSHQWQGLHRSTHHPLQHSTKVPVSTQPLRLIVCHIAS